MVQFRDFFFQSRFKYILALQFQDFFRSDFSSFWPTNSEIFQIRFLYVLLVEPKNFAPISSDPGRKMQVYTLWIIERFKLSRTFNHIALCVSGGFLIFNSSSVVAHVLFMSRQGRLSSQSNVLHSYLPCVGLLATKS